MPPDFKIEEGQSVKQNVIQQWLWECWLDANKWVLELANGDPFAVVLNGDLIEGNHHRTSQIIGPDIGDHIKAASESLDTIAGESSRLFVVRGTECHTGNTEASLGKHLGATPNPETGSYAWDRLLLDINGVRCVWRHHIGTTMRRGLAATQLSIQLAEEQVEAANSSEPIPRVLCCAHRHKFGFYQDHNGMAVVSPPWQGLSRFGHKVVSQATTNPGVFALDFRGLRHGELPRLHSRVYEAQKPASITL